MKSDFEMFVLSFDDDVKMPEKQETNLSEAELLYYELVRAIEEEEEVRCIADLVFNAFKINIRYL